MDEIQAANDGLKTPKRMRFEKMKSNFNLIENIIETHPFEAQKAPKISRLDDSADVSHSTHVEVMINQWNEIVNQIEEIWNSLNDNLKADKVFREKIVEAHLIYQSEIGKSEDMSRLLQNQIGNNGKLFKESTIWEALSELKEEGISLGRQLETIPSLKQDLHEVQCNVLSCTKRMKKFPDMEVNIRAIEGNLSKLKDHYVQTFKVFKHQLSTMHATNVGNS